MFALFIGKQRHESSNKNDNNERFDPIESVVHSIIKRTKHECSLPIEIDSSGVDKYHAIYP